MKKESVPKIVMYGFDKIGYIFENDNLIKTSDFEIELIPFSDSITSENIDGIIIPQGIFEEFEQYDNLIHTETTVRCFEDQLLGIERKVISHLRNKKWICFLVQEIIDTVPQGFKSQSVRDTDLCKRILNLLNVNRAPIIGQATVLSKRNEFDSYINNYGVAKTKFILPNDVKDNCKIIATNGSSIVGFDHSAKIFILPFHTIKKTENDLNSLAINLCSSLLSYRQKRIIETPEWLNDFMFIAEKQVKKETKELLTKVEENYAKLDQFSKYKAILTTSGENLRNIIVEIFEKILKLKIDPIDEFIEDFKIIGNNDDIISIVEVKGSKKGIKREFINQVDSHRERNKLSTKVLGILIINNEMGINGIAKRSITSVPNPQIIHSLNMHILIIRTIDLLYFINHFEKATDKDKLINLILNTEGGWLKVDENGYEIITENEQTNS